MNTSAIDPSGTSESRPGWLWIRVILIGLGGAGSGLLSCRVKLFGDVEDNTWIWTSGPGIVFGVFWLVLAWIPGCLTVRPQIRRSWLWSLAFFAGVTLSYVGAYHAAYHSAVYLTEEAIWEEQILIIGGFLGGLIGSVGLVCMWSLLFRSVHTWFTKSVLIACGALLGTTLNIWDLNGEGEGSLYVFFMTWQGGMAVALAAADLTWRIRNRAGSADPDPLHFQP